MPRSELGQWAASRKRQDPLDILREQATTRVADLVPIRHGRMAASPFAFFRGAAAIMSADLAATPNSGLVVQLCGDAHLSNFGGFASPERSLVFDVNDFDETLPGPFEWDVKRLAASLEIAARSRDFDGRTRRRITTEASAAYREAMRGFAEMTYLDMWNASLDVEGIMQSWSAELGGAALKRFQRAVSKAGSKDRLKAKAKLTEVLDGELRFVSDPPLLIPAEQLFSERDHEELLAVIRSVFASYAATLPDHMRYLLGNYRFVDLARKVVGVGSVGTRSWVALLEGRDHEDPLFVQVKEAEASVLEPFLAPSEYDNHGQRVVEGQRLMQPASDIFLGWARVDSAVGEGGRSHDYYMRSLWDWKVSANVALMEPQTLGMYGRMCGWTLARSHARSGDAIAIGAYLGQGSSFDRAMTTFAGIYADQSEADHRRLVDSIAAGTVQAQTGI